MASISCATNIVSVSCGTKTLIVRLNDGELFSFEHSEFSGKNIDDDVTDCSQTQSKVHSESEEIGLGLVCCDVSSNGEQLAFCTLSKHLCIVNTKESKPTIVRIYNLVRGASKVRFTPINNHVVVADKSGDVYLFMPENVDGVGQLIVGHLSLLLDVLVTPDEQFIITCDRDEKIRVSSYPNGYNIVAYCLGHSEFVSSLRILPHNIKYLISTSGDGTIRFWDYKTGEEITTCNTSQYFDSEGTGNVEKVKSEVSVAAITDAATTFVDSSTSLICVSIDNFSACLVFKCSSDNDGLNCRLMQKLSLENCQPWGLSLNSNSLWLAMCSNDIILVQSKSLNTEQCKFNDEVSSDVMKVVQVINNQRLIADQKKNVVNLLFKRKFENVQDYFNKKELRLMEQKPSVKKLKA